jgi:uncharacterized protein YciI
VRPQWARPANSLDACLLLFRCESAQVPEQFARADPYVKRGIVRRYRIRPWTTAVGDQAATPVRPD